MTLLQLHTSLVLNISRFVHLDIILICATKGRVVILFAVNLALATWYVELYLQLEAGVLGSSSNFTIMGCYSASY